MVWKRHHSVFLKWNISFIKWQNKVVWCLWYTLSSTPSPPPRPQIFVPFAPVLTELCPSPKHYFSASWPFIKTKNKTTPPPTPPAQCIKINFLKLYCIRTRKLLGHFLGHAFGLYHLFLVLLEFLAPLLKHLRSSAFRETRQPASWTH